MTGKNSKEKPGVDTRIARKMNRDLLLEVIFSHKPISRADISRLTGLNKATVSYLIQELVDMGLVVMGNERLVTGARQGLSLELNRDYGLFLACELRYTGIRSWVINLQGELISEHRSSLAEKNFDAVKELIMEHIKEHLAKIPFSLPLKRIGFSIAGTVDLQKKIVFSPYFEWSDIILKSLMERAFNVPVEIENEANLASLAEYYEQQQKPCHFILLHIDSGVGLGMIANGFLQLGADGVLGEFGHTTLIPDGKVCNCGNRGCFEMYASEYQVLRHFQHLWGEDVTLEFLIQQIAQSNPVAIKVYEQFITYLGIGVHNLIVTYNPDLIVLNSFILRSCPDALVLIKNSLQSKVLQNTNIQISHLVHQASLEGLSILLRRLELEIPLINQKV